MKYHTGADENLPMNFLEPWELIHHQHICTADSGEEYYVKYNVN